MTRALLTGLLACAISAMAALAGCDPSHAGRSTAPADAPASSASHVLAMARGSVVVPGGLLEIGAPQDGLVEVVTVEEGDSVKRGQLLIRLSADSQRQELAMARAELQLSRTKLAAQQARLPAASTLAQRTAEAARAEAIDPQRADEAAQALRDIEAGVAVARAELAVAEQKVTQVNVLSGRLAVHAPEDATVVRRQVQPGTRVSTQSSRPLLTLLPARALQIRAEVNETFAPRIRVGMQAQVFLDGDVPAPPGLPGAKVIRISPIFGGSRLDEDASSRGRVRVIDCFLEFDRAPSLRVGQAVRVEFHD